MMIHDFDLCRFYLGKDEIKEIHASVSSFPLVQVAALVDPSMKIEIKCVAMKDD